MRFVSDHCNQIIIIPFDIKNRAITYRIGMSKGLPYIREVLPRGLARDIVPIQQWNFGVRPFLPELAQFPFAYNSQGLVPPSKLPFWEPLVE
jgi:hypothetical protein